MKKWILTAAVVCAALGASEAQAGDIYGPQKPSPFSNHPKGSYSSYGRTLPVFMAAPWYLYWPYDAHFMTPAPMQGAFYAPPVMGNYPVQPYFPTPQYVAPQGQAPLQIAPAAYQPPR